MRISDWSSDVCSSDLVQIVHVLRDDSQVDPCIFEPRQREVGGVGGDGCGGAAPGVVEREHGGGVAGEALRRGDVRDVVALPQPAGVTEGRQAALGRDARAGRSEEHTSELQSLMRISYAVFCLQNKTTTRETRYRTTRRM